PLLEDIPQGRAHQPPFPGVARAASVVLQLTRELRQRAAPPRSRRAFGTTQRLTNRGDPCIAQSLRSIELVHVRACHRKARWPGIPRLSLDVEIVQVRTLRRIQL